MVSRDSIEEDECDTTVSLLDVHETSLSFADVTSETDLRGVDLASEELPGGRDLLTEYHDLMSMGAERVCKCGATNGTVEEYETALRGFVSDGYYGYETVDGFRERGKAPTENPKEHLASIVEEITERNVETEVVSKATEERLENLGYV